MRLRGDAILQVGEYLGRQIFVADGHIVARVFDEIEKFERAGDDRLFQQVRVFDPAPDRNHRSRLSCVIIY
jgi:hypothetical protein